jgi:multidrug efflux pump subunit AcrB
MGIAGRLARMFLQSKLTPLITLASLATGLLAMMATPREEEPQISVPMIDVFVQAPDLAPKELENLAIRGLERRMWEISGVEHVYSMAGDGHGMVTVRFKVGENQETSIVKVQAKLASSMDELPAGMSPPLVKAHSIDDVPILALTLHSQTYGSNELREIAVHLEDEIRTLTDVAQTRVIGGSPRQFRVRLDPARLTANGVTPGEVARAVRGSDNRFVAGQFQERDTVVNVRVGSRPAGKTDLERLVVALRGERKVVLADVAVVEDAWAEATSLVAHHGHDGSASAVTLSVSKRPGANATVVAHAALERLESARERLVPDDVTVEVTRNYGETAKHKADELILHIVIATVSVTLLILIFLGWREALVVLVAVPVTLALTLFVYYAMGYSLNRITLFALIFSIGILVDDAIVVVENIYRHMSMGKRRPEDAAVEGVDEVGNPTILATIAVIAAILPMAFVSGMMGPYMRPIPIGASAAMLASLGVAFIVTPWLAFWLLKGHVHAHGHAEETAGPSRFARGYRALMEGLIANRGKRRLFYAINIVLLLGSVVLLFTGGVQVKMLPFDNKSEFQVILDAPRGTTMESSDAMASEIAQALLDIPEVTSAQSYAGTSSPFNFNGLVRHYFLRQGGDVSEVQVNLVGKGERNRQSHEIAIEARRLVEPIAAKYGARAKIAEIPPGPPVLSTLVAEIYAADDSLRESAALQVRGILETTPGVVDVDWSVQAPQQERIFRVDAVEAGRQGVDVAQVAQTLALALSGAEVARIESQTALEPRKVSTRLGIPDRSSVEDLLALPIPTATGPQPLERFVVVETALRESSRMRKDLRPVIYVTADVADTIEAPVYAILAMNKRIDSLRIDGAKLKVYNATAPDLLDETAMKWDGEWQVTIDVFRDLGIAFAVVMLLIYVLVVGWFQSFTIPLVIMAPIPLTLIGIMPGHALTGAFFTATSMIGMIALAGIIVRNSILLVDFIQLSEERGVAVAEAVIEAGLVRFRPIALTAAAVVVGGIVMVLDPIFQGLAVALMSGAVVATLLTMVLVPLLYWELLKNQKPGEKS